MSFFESFLGGAAQAGTGILQDQMKEEQVQRMAKFQEELAMERQRTINAMNQENAIAAEKRGIENRATERGQIRTEEIADEPRRRESKVADYKASKMAEYDPQIQELQRKAETEKVYDEKGEVSWGFQIRNYVLQPYTLAKDVRTGHSTSQVMQVLDGDLDPFIQSYLKMKATGKAPMKAGADPD